MIQVTTQGMPDGFGCLIASDDDTVAELRVFHDEEGERTLILDILGDTSSPGSAGEVLERLAYVGYRLEDLSDVEELVRYAKAYGVRVYRHPDESARFRMEFVSGEFRGQVVEIDVRTDGTKVTEIPDDWQPMTGMVDDVTETNEEEE